MMNPSNGKTARNQVLPGPIREQRDCAMNAGFDEILLSPGRLAGLVDSKDIDMNHLNIYHNHQEGPDEDYNKGKIQRVLPALEESNNDSDLEVEEEQEEKGKLPPVKLQKVLSEDLSWLDTIIYPTTTTPTTTVKQQDHPDHSVRCDKESMYRNDGFLFQFEFS